MAKKPTGGSTKKNSAQQVPKCTCQDPFKCDCGNRPPRPSKGHKWYPETQEWAGKGHKQKGASGQTADVAKQAITTDVGKTQVAQWQCLPTALLDEACQKQGRARPHFVKLVDSTTSSQQFRYRVLVPHPGKQQPGSSDRDLVFLPAMHVENEEQAKQEAALLALLQLTPNLPHERKLPEPYKTTWLHAIANNAKKNEKVKQQQSAKSSTMNQQSKPLSSNISNDDKAVEYAAVAKASTNLTMANEHISVAEKKRKEQEQRKLKNEIIHRKEAIRLANRDHPVFLSPKLRRELESMLRNDDDMTRHLLLQEDSDEDDDMGAFVNEAETEPSDLQYYIRDRLAQQGFTKAQARAAFLAVAKPNNQGVSTNNLESFEFTFDECLQWLCIHLDEDQLPEKFDPRGRTLDVLAPTKPTGIKTTLASSSSFSPVPVAQINGDMLDKNMVDFANHEGKIDGQSELEVQTLAAQYGIDPEEAKLILEQASTQQQSPPVDNLMSFEQVLWDTLCRAAASLGGGVSVGNNDQDFAGYDASAQQQMLDDELEAIAAIFPDENECRIEHQDEDRLVVQLRHSALNDNEVFLVKVVVVKSPSAHGRKLPYPWVPPNRVLISRLDGIANSSSPSTRWYHQGAFVHVRLIQFMQSLPRGEPMLFEIFGHIQKLIQDANSGELKSVSLRPFLKCTEASTVDNQLGEQVQIANVNLSTSVAAVESKLPLSAPLQKKALPRRPRDRSFFWSTPPYKTPPAVAFPTISREMQTARGSLPAAMARSNFFGMMKAADQGGRVVLVTGDTGCGKTTQIPAFILEESPIDAKIVVAQPRRLAATGVAARVANERGETKAGTGSVGYVVRGDTAICKSTRLLFCTTGILLRQLQCENALACVTHIVVDEVHERHLDTDVLLGILKESLKSNPHLRIVLMSATLDADRFASYWGCSTPRLHIPGRTFPVLDYTLEDVLKLTGYIPPKQGKKQKWNAKNRNFRKASSWADSEKSEEEENPTNNEGDEGETSMSRPDQPFHNIPIEDLVNRIDETSIDYDLLGQLVKCLLRSNKVDEIGSILVFLPGAPEINMAIDVVRRVTKNLAVQLLPLHGGLLPEDQNMVFRPAQKGFTNVILSTNVAETSITIPDCTIVVDSCREKQSSYDPMNRMPLLLERFASKASLKQRRGRAGRVKEGTCYKLISKPTLEKLPEHSEPEILRCALDQTLLSLLFLGIENGTGNFLRKLLDPPSTEAVTAAVSSLQNLGAVSEPDENDSMRSLTPLGMHLAAIPAPPTVGKTLVMGCILGCRSAALAMAASMSVGRSPFLRIEPTRRQASCDGGDLTIDEMKQKRVTEERAALAKTVGNSDHALIAAAYLQWDAAGLGTGERKRFCDLLGLSFNGMREMKLLVQQLSDSLSSVGFFASEEADCNIKSWRVIRTTAVASLAPSQIVRVQRPGAKYAETAEGAMEKDGVAKELKFFIRSQSDGGQADSSPQNLKGYHGVNEERVFLHPASINFSVGSFSCPWLVYHELVQTSKAFVRDSTECSTYALLLFGGKLKVQADKNSIVIGDWVQFSAVGRIGALIGGLRRKVDELLLRKIDNPSFDIAQTTEMRLIVKLLSRDGLH